MYSPDATKRCSAFPKHGRSEEICEVRFFTIRERTEFVFSALEVSQSVFRPAVELGNVVNDARRFFVAVLRCKPARRFWQEPPVYAIVNVFILDRLYV